MRESHRQDSEPEARTVSPAKLRADLAETLNRVAYGEETVVIERRGRPLAALISYDEYRLLQRLIVRDGLC
jgi:prevent-host-death family protein